MNGEPRDWQAEAESEGRWAKEYLDRALKAEKKLEAAEAELSRLRQPLTAERREQVARLFRREFHELNEDTDQYRWDRAGEPTQKAWFRVLDAALRELGHAPQPAPLTDEIKQKAWDVFFDEDMKQRGTTREALYATLEAVWPTSGVQRVPDVTRLSLQQRNDLNRVSCHGFGAVMDDLQRMIDSGAVPMKEMPCQSNDRDSQNKNDPTIRTYANSNVQSAETTTETGTESKTTTTEPKTSNTSVGGADIVGGSTGLTPDVRYMYGDQLKGSSCQSSSHARSAQAVNCSGTTTANSTTTPTTGSNALNAMEVDHTATQKSKASELGTAVPGLAASEPPGSGSEDEWMPWRLNVLNALNVEADINRAQTTDIQRMEREIGSLANEISRINMRYGEMQSRIDDVNRRMIAAWEAWRCWMNSEDDYKPVNILAAARGEVQT